MPYVIFADIVTGEVFRTDTDLNLIVARVSVGSPQPRMNLISVPGMDGSLDCSEATDGTLHYDPRPIIIEAGKTITARHQQDSTIKNALHGRRMRITLADDPQWYYVGRVNVGEWVRDCGIGRVTIECTCDPWKLKNEQSTVSRADLSANYKQLQLPNERRPVVPSITVEQTTTLLWQGNTYTVNAGTHRLPDIQLQAGDNILKAKVPDSDTGSITVEYQEASL